MAYATLAVLKACALCVWLSCHTPYSHFTNLGLPHCMLPTWICRRPDDAQTGCLPADWPAQSFWWCWQRGWCCDLPTWSSGRPAELQAPFAAGHRRAAERWGHESAHWTAWLLPACHDPVSQIVWLNDPHVIVILYYTVCCHVVACQDVTVQSGQWLYTVMRKAWASCATIWVCHMNTVLLYLCFSAMLACAKQGSAKFLYIHCVNSCETHSSSNQLVLCSRVRLTQNGMISILPWAYMCAAENFAKYHIKLASCPRKSVRGKDACQNLHCSFAVLTMVIIIDDTLWH